jgi:predicted GNAT family acetyltransferase
MDPHVLHNKEQSRYDLFLGEELIGLADYVNVDGELQFTHTEVNPEHQGKNYAAILMREAFADIEANNLGKVWPVCPYVVTYMKRHPETAHLLSRTSS